MAREYPMDLIEAGAWQPLPGREDNGEPIPNPLILIDTQVSQSSTVPLAQTGGRHSSQAVASEKSFLPDSKASNPKQQLTVILSVLATGSCLLGILSLAWLQAGVLTDAQVPGALSSGWDPAVLKQFYPSREGLDNGLSRTPAMGWNSWNTLACDVDEDDVKAAADLIVSLGLKDIGYRYINVDDCWHGERLRNGSITSDPSKFPSGMRALGDYIHSKGLKFGIYSDAGWQTCAGRPGSWGHEDIDAQTYASWGVDYLKYDNCYTDGLPGPKVRYPIMRDALNATGRPILYSMCEWGVEDPAEWAGDVGNSWRTTGDIEPTWESVMILLEANNQWAAEAGPGGFNDPDMLEVGVRRPQYGPVMTMAEEASHFALWALMKSPLLIGADLRSIPPGSLHLLKNKDIIAINQDPLGIQGRLVGPLALARQAKSVANSHEVHSVSVVCPMAQTEVVRGWVQMKTEEGLPNCQVWAAPLEDGSAAVVLFNAGDDDMCSIGVRPEDVGLAQGRAVAVRDLMGASEGRLERSEYRATIAPHAVQVVKLTATWA